MKSARPRTPLKFFCSSSLAPRLKRCRLCPWGGGVSSILSFLPTLYRNFCRNSPRPLSVFFLIYKLEVSVCHSHTQPLVKMCVFLSLSPPPLPPSLLSFPFPPLPSPHHSAEVATWLEIHPLTTIRYLKPNNNCSFQTEGILCTLLPLV